MSVRALRSGRRVARQGVGPPAQESVARVTLDVLDRPFRHEGTIVLLRYDAFLRKQDWGSLCRANITVDSALQMALRFGVRSAASGA